jgi:hypothetical protein
MKTLGWVLLVVGVVGFRWAFKLQSDANAAADSLAGADTSSTIAPWVVGVGGVVLGVVGLILLAVAAELAKRDATAKSSSHGVEPAA